MTPTVPDPRLDIQRKPAVAGLRLDAKDDRKKLAVDWRKRQADVFVRVLELGRMTPHGLSQALKYSDQSQVSRWASGADRPQWDRIAGVEQLAPFIAVAWGEATGADVQITITVRAAA